jgi:PAS domain S-box-containing protein
VEERYGEKVIDYQLFESMPVNSIVVSAASSRFLIVALTDDYAKLSGLSKKQVVGTPFFEAFPDAPSNLPEGIPRLRDSFEQVVAEKKAHNIESQRYDIRDEHGVLQPRYWSARNKPILDQFGQVTHIIHTVTEITELVLAEQSKRQSEFTNKGYQLFMHAPVAVCIVRGADYIVELANEGMRQLLGRDAAMVGKPIIESLPEAKLQGLVSILDHVRSTGQTYQVSSFPATLLINGVREDRFFDLVFRQYLQDDSEAETTIFCLANNVTEEVRSRQQVKEMAETLNFRNAILEAQNHSSHDGVLIIDSAGAIILYNRRFIEIWKMPEEILALKSDLGLLNYAAAQTVDEALFFNKVQEIYASPERLAYDELLLKDGRVISRTGTPVVGSNGKKYGWAWNFRDITERIRQEQKFRNVLEQAPTPILILKGPELSLEVANTPLLKLWNVDETAFGKPLLEILPEVADQPYLALLQKVYRDGTAEFGHEQPMYFVREDQTRELHYFNYSYQPYKENNGVISGVLVMAMDVTEQVIANQKVRDTEANFKTLLMQAPIGISILKGQNLDVELINDTCLFIIQRSREEMLGHSLWNTMPELKRQGFHEVVEQVLSSGFAYSVKEYETVIIRDGRPEHVYLDFVCQPLSESSGMKDRIMVIVIDTTSKVLARRKIEEAEVRARLAVDSAELGTYEVDLRTDEIIASERMSEIMDIDMHAERSEFIDAFIEEDKPVRKAAHLLALTTGKLQYIARIRKHNGSIHWVKVMGRIYFDDDHRPFKLVGVLQDITEQKHFSDELSRLVELRTHELQTVNDELKRSNTELEQFAYISSHDLQEPLRKIKVFSTMILDQDGERFSEMSLKRFNKIVDAADRMTNSLRDLLEFASLSNDDRFEQVDLNSVIENVKNDLELVISQKHALIEYYELPTTHAIPLQMHQLFYNLLNNALKFSREDVEPYIRISCRVLLESEYPETKMPGTAGYYEILVTDNGIGFDESYADKIFTIFKRLHNRDSYTGTGIGLSICRKVVHNHGGEISARSTEGEGATFVILLPYRS